MHIAHLSRTNARDRRHPRRTVAGAALKVAIDGDKSARWLENISGLRHSALMVPYVPLRVFSCFTMLEGAIEPKAIAKHAARLGFPAAALVDRNGLYAAMPFGDACFAAGVQPIIGATLYFMLRPAPQEQNRRAQARHKR
mgnify:CR=1 FL=1